MAIKDAKFSDIEALEKRLMDVAVRETEELLDSVATEERIIAATGDEEALNMLTKWKKNVAHSYLLAERMIRYITAKRTARTGGGGLSEEDYEEAQRIATQGVRGARDRLKLVKGG